MKRITTLIFLLGFLAVLGTPTPRACAANIAPEGRVRKLQRGVINIMLSPMEITDKIVENQKYYTALPSWIPGMVKGMVYMIARCFSGAYDLVTAPIPLPANYAPLMKPEFPWEYFDLRDKEPRQVDIKST